MDKNLPDTLRRAAEFLEALIKQRRLAFIRWTPWYIEAIREAADELERLAAYEATGLTPEEIGEMKTAYDENQMPYAIEATGSEAVHIHNLLLAEAQGRLLVLPCKVGDEIYRIIKPSGVYKPFVSTLPDKVEPFGIYYKNLMGAYSYIPFDELGRTVFLTREEAEQRLKEG